MTRREKQLYNALTKTNRLLFSLRFGGLVDHDSTINRIIANNRVLVHECPTCGVVD